MYNTFMKQTLQIMFKEYKLQIFVFLVLLGIFTVFDQQLCTLLYHPGNIYGAFFEKFTYLPGCYLLFLSTTILYVHYFKTNNKKFQYLTMLMCTVSFFITSYYFYEALAGIGMVLHIILSLCIIFACIKWKQLDAYVKTAWIVIFTILAALLTVELFKMLWGRVRPYANLDNSNYYTPWFELNFSDFKTYFENSDTTKSFPSGHSNWATLTLCYSFYFKKHQKMAITTSVIYILLVTTSRVVYGMHHPSDVLCGCAIAYAYYSIAKHKVKHIKQTEVSI